MSYFGDDDIRNALDEVIANNKKEADIKGFPTLIAGMYKTLIECGIDDQHATYMVGQLLQGIGEGLGRR